MSPTLYPRQELHIDRFQPLLQISCDRPVVLHLAKPIAEPLEVDVLDNTTNQTLLSWPFRCWQLRYSIEERGPRFHLSRGASGLHRETLVVRGVPVSRRAHIINEGVCCEWCRAVCVHCRRRLVSYAHLPSLLQPDDLIFDSKLQLQRRMRILCKAHRDGFWPTVRHQPFNLHDIVPLQEASCQALPRLLFSGPQTRPILKDGAQLVGCRKPRSLVLEEHTLVADGQTSHEPFSWIVSSSCQANLSAQKRATRGALILPLRLLFNQWAGPRELDNVFGVLNKHLELVR
mmetsp:Transcript_1992/g.5670  ORF Transcript_1992/g.5670 Transcript_1992/m.5670 type:complete len:288 (+) Transcript_1992:467-1330(+)